MTETDASAASGFPRMDMSTQHKPLITTILPTFRRPKLLRRAILSVLEQDFPAFQLCVYDNASGDETAEIVAELGRNDSRLRYHCHARNIGGMANFQHGLSRVDTPYFSFLSDDDYLLPGFYRASAASLAESPEAIFWAGLTLRLTGEGDFFDARLDKWERDGLFFPPDGVMRLLRGDAPCWVGTLFRSTAIEEIGLLDEQVGGAIDLDYMLRLAARHPYIVSKMPAAIYTMNKEAASETSPLSAFWPGWLKMIDNIEAIESLPADTRHGIVLVLHADARRMLFRRGASALAKGSYEFARQSALALQKQYHALAKSLLLRSIAMICEHVPLTQRIYTACYRALERRLINQRGALKKKYAGLSRPY